MKAIRNMLAGTARRISGKAVEMSADEPPMEDAYREWREFYANRNVHYASILKELGEQNDDYTSWYRSGGYGYDPKQSRQWILADTSIPDFRGPASMWAPATASGPGSFPNGFTSPASTRWPGPSTWRTR
jgi:hypothetical protein